MTEVEIQELSRLLRKLSQEHLGTPNMPWPIFQSLKGVVAQPAVELLVTSNGRDVLLTRRDDEFWSGYHIPGGFVGCSEDLQMAVTRVARNELGVDAVLERIVGHYTWPDHPYASAVSLLCACRLAGTPRTGTFFETLPADVVLGHRRLLETFWF